MANLVFPPSIELDQVDDKVGNADYTGAKLHLYSNDMTPDENTVVADFTECVFSGYAAKVVTWSAAFFDENNVAVSSGGEQLFVMSGATPDVAYGCYLTNAAGTVLLASGRFDTSPDTFAKTGDAAALNLKIGLSLGTVEQSVGP